MLDQHVEVAHRAERAAEPAELGAERLRRLGVEQVAAGAEERPQAPRRHPQLVQLLWVGAEPRPGIVCEQLLGLLAEARAQDARGRGVVAALERFGLEVEIERLEDLGPALAVGGACTAERLLESPQRLLVAVQKLHLELLETSCDPLVVEHGDRVVDDLGAVGPDPLATRLQAGDRQQRDAAKVAGEERAAAPPAAPSARPVPRARAARRRVEASAAKVPCRSRPGGAA